MPERESVTENLKKAREAVFRLLKIRFRSEQEIRERLTRKQFSQETIEQTIPYFKELGLIDDRQFAQKWISSRLLKPLGINRIQFELRNKGVQDEIIQEALKNLTDDYPEEEIVFRLAKRQVSKYKNTDLNKSRQRIYGYLARRGFRSATILKALKNIPLPDCRQAGLDGRG